LPEKNNPALTPAVFDAEETLLPCPSCPSCLACWADSKYANPLGRLSGSDFFYISALGRSQDKLLDSGWQLFILPFSFRGY
jgi:hypothetical protein